MKKLTVLLIAWLSMFGYANAQNTVSGTVTDKDGWGIPGVNVVVKGTTNGTSTDIDGKFTLTIAEDTAIIEFTAVGMQPIEFNYNKQTGGGELIAIQMFENASLLDEVVVVGYGTQARSQMTTSVSKLDAKTLENATLSNAATALQGSIPGLKVTQTTGQPGSTPSLVMRGGTSFDGTGDPLILIDGVPGSFFALNSNDIASIEVLKDAASTAIYGARAANGVILVTTKQGKKGKSNITFRAKYGINKYRKDPMKYLGAADYIKFNRMAVKNSQMVRGTKWLNQFLTGNHAAATGNNTTNSIYTTMILTDDNRYLLNQPGWQTMDDPVNAGQVLIYQANQMNELIYRDNCHTTDYGISFDGGNDKGTYYLSLGYLDDQGLVWGSEFKRYSGAFNASYNITDNFKIQSNIIYAHSNYNKPFDTEYNLFQRTAGLAPTSRIYNNNPDGTLSDDYQPGTYLGFGNPLYYKDKFIRSNLEQRLTASVQAEYSFWNNFKATVRGSHFTVNNADESFNKAYLNSGRLNTERIASAAHGRSLRNQFTAYLNYKNTFLENHNVSALVGGEYFRDKYFSFNASTRLSPTDLIPTLNAGSEASGTPSSYHTEYAISSVFGQVNYDFDYKYLLGLTFRYDGTSRLDNNRYGFFPGVSMGWNAHNETFFKDSKVSNYVSKLKPRLSYGVNGNIDILSNYGVYGAYSTTPVYDSQTGYANTSLPLLDLKWERSTTLNFGLDLGLFNNRVTVIADYFVRDVEDKLANLTLPLWTGFGSIKTNNGILRNKGFELQVNGKVLDSDDWKWNLGLTYYTVKNFAHKLPANGVDKNRQGGREIYDPSTGETKYVGGLQEGERVGYDLITAYVFEGVYQTQEQIDAHKDRRVEFAHKKDQRFLGDAIWKDVNGDNIIDYRDRVVIGRSTPKFTGGFTSDLTWKNLNLFVKTDFAVGHYLANGRRIKGIAQTQGNQNGPLEIKDSWTPENPTSNIPRFDLVDQQRNHMAAGGDQGSMSSGSSRFWEKGDYLALREITLSYNLDGKVVNNLFQNARFFITGTNLAFFDGFSGSSPEEAMRDNYANGYLKGRDIGRFPTPRTITFGVNVTF